MTDRPEGPERLDVSAGSIRLACFQLGAVDAPPLVALHGLGEQAASFDPVAAELAARFRVLAVDLRGHGESDWPGWYTFEQMAADVLGLCDALGLDEVTLIGHSMGGMVGYLIAQQQPGRVRRLIVEVAPVPRASANRVIPERPDGPLPFDWPVVPAILGQLNNPDPAWWAELPEITAPALLIGGGPESHISAAELAATAGRLPDARLVTIPAGHYVHTRQAAAFAAAVVAFTETAGASAGAL